MQLAPIRPEVSCVSQLPSRLESGWWQLGGSREASTHGGRCWALDPTKHMITSDCPGPWWRSPAHERCLYFMHMRKYIHIIYYGAVLCIALHYSTVECFAMQYSPAQWRALQYAITVHPIASHCNTLYNYIHQMASRDITLHHTIERMNKMWCVYWFPIELKQQKRLGWSSRFPWVFPQLLTIPFMLWHSSCFIQTPRSLTQNRIYN